MLPATIVTFFSFLLELCSASPLYNMQPAYITTNIGTTGRNIRNLPCISRKTNQSGVCMFAIDCHKQNGTHLGTCIDRFFFGSCCHIEPIQEVSNSIDTALIPEREPPYRLSTTSTIKPSQQDSIEIIPSKTKPTNQQRKTTPRPTNTITNDLQRISTEKTTTPKKEYEESEGIDKTTVKFGDKVAVTDKPLNKEGGGETTTEISYKLSTFQSVDVQTTTVLPITTTTQKIVSKVTQKQTQRPTTVRPLKPVKVTKLPVTANKPVTKPSSVVVKPNNSSVPSKPRPVSSQKPTRVTAKPTKAPPQKTKSTTKKPVHTTNKLQTRPQTVQTTKAPKITTTVKVPTTIAEKVTIITTTPTPKPASTAGTRKTTTTSSEPSSSVVSTSTKLPLSTTVNNLTDPPRLVGFSTTTESNSNLIGVDEDVKATTMADGVTATAATTVSTSSSSSSSSGSNVVDVTTPKPVVNEIPNITSIFDGIGNVATNEIVDNKPQLVSTVDSSTKPSFVTWAVADNAPHNDSSVLLNNDTTSVPEEWVPITTPDGWVLLPSVSTMNPNQDGSSVLTERPILSSTATISTTTSTVTKKPEVTSPSSSSSFASSSESTTLKPTPETPVQTSSPVTETRPVVSTDSSQIVDSNSTALPISVPTMTTTDSPSYGQGVNMTDFTDVCGRRIHPEARIVGGSKTSFGKWPWQISLRQWRTSTYLHKCGAALLNENWAITAAHCVDNVPPSDLLLRLGEHDLSTEEEPYLHQERRVQIVASHPQFDPRTFEYDLALLRFYEPVRFQPNIIPVCVPQNDENFVGKTAYVTGWGRLYEDGPLPSVLQEVSVPVINNTVCETMYRQAGYIEHIPHIFICAGWRRGGFDSCEGDSGGPMVIQRPDKRFLLAGVISWGIGCAEPNQPGVYTRISEFRDWINQILQF